VRARLERIYTLITGREPRPPRRSQYKDVWTPLSKKESEAKRWVQGSTDDETLERTAIADLERLRRHLTFDQSSDVLEIGCGVGRLGKVFAPVCRSWTGCDVSPHMLKHARVRLAAFSNVRFVELSGYDLSPIPSSALDVVYCSVVFMHLSEWDRYSYVVEARRVLRPGGQLYVDNMSLTTETGWTFFESARATPPERRPPMIGQTSTPQEFEVYFERAGFTNRRVEIVDDAWVVGLGIK
jgi:ubiquinone/menaquinone biosynthesis C-methylase UbiE